MKQTGWLLSACVLLGAWASASAAEPGKKLCQFKTGKNGEPIRVPVVFKGKTYPFLIDTGASATTLDTSLEKLLGKPKATMKTLVPESQPGGGTKEVEHKRNVYYAPDAKMGPISLQSGGPAMCVNLQDVREALGVDVYGIIGTNVLRRYAIQLDPTAGTLTFYESTLGKRPEWGKAVPIALTEYGQPLLPIRMPEVGPGAVEGAEIETAFLVDTGYPEGGQFSEALFKYCQKGKAYSKPTAMPFDTGAGIELVPTMRGFGFSLGDGLDYKNLVVSQGRRGNLLGRGWLGRHVTTIDFPNAMMYLKKGPAFDVVDEVDLTGMQLAAKEEGIVVVRVLKDSPAAKAGLQAGDVLTKLGTTVLERKHLPGLQRVFRTLPSKPGTGYEVHFRRKDQEFKTVLPLARRV